jgi:hypothetical protein
MSKFIIISLFLFSFSFINAQVPQGIPYQAVARNGQGQPLANTNVIVRFSILDSTATGTAVYVESHSITTSSLGLFTANVGMGTASTGAFSSINWGQNFKFLKVELDTTATGISFIDLGTQQMMSVPYALYAGYSNSIMSASYASNYLVLVDSLKINHNAVNVTSNFNYGFNLSHPPKGFLVSGYLYMPSYAWPCQTSSITIRVKDGNNYLDLYCTQSTTTTTPIYGGNAPISYTEYYNTSSISLFGGDYRTQYSFKIQIFLKPPYSNQLSLELYQVDMRYGSCSQVTSGANLTAIPIY